MFLSICLWMKAACTCLLAGHTRAQQEAVALVGRSPQSPVVRLIITCTEGWGCRRCGDGTSGVMGLARGPRSWSATHAYFSRKCGVARGLSSPPEGRHGKQCPRQPRLRQRMWQRMDGCPVNTACFRWVPPGPHARPDLCQTARGTPCTYMVPRVGAGRAPRAPRTLRHATTAQRTPRPFVDASRTIARDHFGASGATSWSRP